MSQDYTSSIDTQFAFKFNKDELGIEGDKFPFKVVLTFRSLIDFWESLATDGASPTMVACAQQVQSALKDAPELREPIEDLSKIKQHEALLETLMSAIVPSALREGAYVAAMVPFDHPRFIYATPALKELLASGDVRKSLDEDLLFSLKLLNAYKIVLNGYYGLRVPSLDYPMVLTVKDTETGLEKHFQMELDPQFCALEIVGEPPQLTEAQKKDLLNRLTDFKVLMELIPPKHFEFHGFTVVCATEVTDQEVLSSIKHDLIERGSLISKTGFARLQNRMRTLFRLPDLTLSFAALQGDQVLLLNSGCQIEQNCIYHDTAHYKRSDFAGSIYEQAATSQKVVVINDLLEYPERTHVEEQMLEYGVRSFIVAPLYNQDKLIGTLDLASPNPGALNTINALKLREVLPLFSMAMQQSLDELDNNIQTIIKEKCTAIHPSVEWRFRKAAMNFIEVKRQETDSDIESIVFEHVYPLYGVSDIRDSSTQRNAAIRADLMEHMTLAREIVDHAQSYRPLPFLDELSFRIGKNIQEVEAGLSAGDEMGIIEFLRRDVEPFFEHLQEFGPGMRDKIFAYRETLHPEIGTLYRRRKDFDESVTRLNKMLSGFLDEAQQEAQAMFPHYFEKHTTDGIDHSIYIGASLVADGKFDLLYLKNLRLWQLITVCQMAQKAEQLKRELPVPLELAHLIAVQNTPLSIRFRFDEKQFDVDGTYNIRYEIMKKRIDKAMVRGRSERLTQPGKIAIVYSQSKEAWEYHEYIEYLQAAGYLGDTAEDLELAELQGIQGLKALRVTVNLE